MQHEIKKSGVLVTLTMTEDEFRELYDHFPSRYNSDTADVAKRIDTVLASICDEIDSL